MRHQTIKKAADVEVLVLDFEPATLIFAGIGETFTNLKVLAIGDQWIRFVERENFADMSQLLELHLWQNQIDFLPEDVFLDLENLVRLDVSGNRIRKLPDKIFATLKKIKEINFGRNRIEHLKMDLFVNNFFLEKISAGDNLLKVIDVIFTKLENLIELHLKNAKCVDLELKTKSEILGNQETINKNCSTLTSKKIRPN